MSNLLVIGSALFQIVLLVLVWQRAEWPVAALITWGILHRAWIHTNLSNLAGAIGDFARSLQGEGGDDVISDLLGKAEERRVQ